MANQPVTESANGAKRAATQAEDRMREFAFSDREFTFLRRIVGEHAGIALGDNKRELVYGRLTRRLRQLGMSNFAQYCERVRERPDEEVPEVINAITTNLTSFFRERHHFDYLRDTLLPALRERHGARRRLRFWSAGCSTGEEPYSLAITLAENIPAIESWDVKVLATDIDSNVVNTARDGVYGLERLEGIDERRRKRWFQRGTGKWDGRARVADSLRHLVSFRQLNLMQAWPMRGPFDAIFCRNVMIYFDKPTQTKLLSRFAEVLDRQGTLFIGHSETLHGVSEAFEPAGRTIYRRRG